jgi:hypothetical protein
MDKPIVKVLLLVVMICLWVLSLRSVMFGRWLGEIGNIRRDNHPIWFWCGVGLQNLLCGYVVIAFSRELYVLFRGSP